MSGTYDLTLTKADGTKDIVLCMFPSVPDRHRINHAYRLALGYLRPEDDAPNLDRTNVDDLMACCLAAIGISWRGRTLPDLPTFREMGRDVVAYGEAVSTALYYAGYTDVEEQVAAGRELYRAFIRHMVDVVDSAAKGFPKAPQEK